MKPNELLFAKATESGITVAGLYDRTITILGASIPLSARTGDSVDAFTATPTKPGVIAVVVRTPSRGKGTYPFDTSFLLSVGKTGDGFRVNTDTPWVCSGRLGQITRDGYVQIRIGDEFFAPLPEHDYQCKNREGCRFVEDPNLLCQYLVGDVDAEAIKAAATECTEEEEARKKLPETLTALGETLKEIERQKEHSLNLAAERDKAQKDLQWLKVSSEALRIAVSKQWFMRPSVADALRELAKL